MNHKFSPGYLVKVKSTHQLGTVKAILEVDADPQKDLYQVETAPGRFIDVLASDLEHPQCIGSQIPPSSGTTPSDPLTILVNAKEALSKCAIGYDAGPVAPMVAPSPPTSATLDRSDEVVVQITMGGPRGPGIQVDTMYVLDSRTEVEKLVRLLQGAADTLWPKGEGKPS